MAKPFIGTAQFRALVDRLARASGNSRTEFNRVLISLGRASVTEFKRAAAAVYNVTQRRIGQDLSAEINNALLNVRVSAVGRPLSALNYEGRQTRKGFRFRVLDSAAAVTIKRGFSPASVTIPLRRISDKRTPLVGNYGPAVADMVNNPAVADPALAVLSDRAETDIARRVERLLEV